MDSMKLHCFGVGEGIPCGRRNHASYLYDWEGSKLLLDCGEPVSRSFKAAGVNAEALDAIALSHYHFDHVGGLFLFLQSLWLDQRKRELPIYLPGHGIESIQRMMETACIFPELISYRCGWKPLKSGEAFEVGSGLRVTPYHTTHLEALKQRFADLYPGRFDSFCFLLERGRLRVGHSADLGSVEDLRELVREPLDVLVCELSHFYPETLFEYLKPYPIGLLVLVHVRASWWNRLEELREKAGKTIPEVKVHIPTDGEVLEL